MGHPSLKYTLKDFISKNGGVQKVAKRLGVSAVAVGAWLRKEYAPHFTRMVLIQKMSKGRLTVQDILTEINSK